MKQIKVWEIIIIIYGFSSSDYFASNEMINEMNWKGYEKELVMA
jgi:hypothetical protein